MTLVEALQLLVEGEALDDAGLAAVVDGLFEEDVAPAQVAGLLVALRMRGEGVREIVAFARGLRARMVPVVGVPGAVDSCGTGGDASGTFNVSTAAALVAAGAGVPMAKHGNRAVSGRVGSADVLERLGVRLEAPPERLAACLATVGIAFLHAPALHPAMRLVAPARRALGIRTIFNLVGPLANPAGVRRQLVGVAQARWLGPMAEAIATLGTDRAWVVHGHGGLDELSLSGPSAVVEAGSGGVRSFEVDPGRLGLAPAPVSALRVGSVAESAARIREVLAGVPGPARDVVCLNAAAALAVAGAASDLEDGLALARRAIDDGAAARTLERLVAFMPAEGAA